MSIEKPEEEVVVTNPSDIKVAPATVPSGFVEINSVGEAIVERLALETQFLDMLHRDFFRKSILSPTQKKRRKKNKLARRSRQQNRRRAKGK